MVPSDDLGDHRVGNLAEVLVGRPGTSGSPFSATLADASRVPDSVAMSGYRIRDLETGDAPRPLGEEGYMQDAPGSGGPRRTSNRSSAPGPTCITRAIPRQTDRAPAPREPTTRALPPRQRAPAASRAATPRAATR